MSYISVFLQREKKFYRFCRIWPVLQYSIGSWIYVYCIHYKVKLKHKIDRSSGPKNGQDFNEMYKHSKLFKRKFCHCFYCITLIAYIKFLLNHILLYHMFQELSLLISSMCMLFSYLYMLFKVFIPKNSLPFSATPC